MDGPKEAREAAIAELQAQKQPITIQDCYLTKNGSHIITTPFNPHALSPMMLEALKKNAMMFWSY